MRRLLLLTFSFITFTAMSANENLFPRAWAYLAEPNATERWVVVASDAKDGFFQCQNLATAVRCDIPVFQKSITTEEGLTRNTECREKPHNEIDGSDYHEYLSSTQVNKVKTVLKKYGQVTFPKHCQIEVQSGAIIGTMSEIGVVLEFNFTDYEALAKDYLREVYGITEQDGYTFKTN